MATTIAFIAIITLITAVVSTTINVVALRASRSAYREMLLSEGDGIDPARKKYWGLDRRQKRAGLTAIACYAVCVFCVMPFSASHTLNIYRIGSVIGVTLSMWTILFVPMFLPSEFDISYQVEQQKHEQEMRKLREQSSQEEEK